MKKALPIILFLLLVGTTVSSFTLLNKLRQAKRPVESIVVNTEVLKRKLAAPIPSWMHKQIQRDLKSYSSGITKTMLDQAFHGDRIKGFQLVRFSITNGHLSFSHDLLNLYSRHFRELVACFQKLNEHTKLPNVDFIVSLEDGFSGNPDIGPTFVFAKREDVDSLILVPDIKALAGYGKIRKEIPAGNKKHIWNSKKDLAFWRGSTTGGDLTKTTWNLIPRCKLALLSLANPKHLDAKIHKVVQAESGVSDLLRAKGIVASGVKQVDHLKYKYLVDVDGNSCSYERYFWLLLSNSLVIKQITPNIQWYYGGLEPFKHYLPIKEDLSDLVEKIDWARSHDEEARQIAENATKFIEENLSAEDTLVYLHHLLTEYAKLQTF